MTTILNSSEIIFDYNKKINENINLLDNLKQIIINTNELLEGNIIYGHLNLSILPELYPKQINLYLCGKQTATRVCEIGFNGGHSTMVMLLGREKMTLEYTIFDICEHTYVKSCFNYIKENFNHVNFEFIEGNSIDTMPSWIMKNIEFIGTYDLVHVDGGHSLECIENDMKNADIIVKINGYIIIDDTDIEYINNCVNLYLNSGKYIEVFLLKTERYHHRILQKINTI
jgi:hypothetical protein